MANKYLEKIAGLGTAFREFSNHASGKTLADAHTHNAIRKAMGKPHDMKSTAELEQAHKAAAKKAKNIAGNAAVGTYAVGAAGLVAHHIYKTKKEL